MGDGFQNISKVGRTPDRFEVSSSDQFFGQSDRIDAAYAVFVEPLNGSIDLLVGVTIEVFCLQRFANFINGFVHQQNTAENTAFCIQILRWKSQLVVSHWERSRIECSKAASHHHGAGDRAVLVEILKPVREKILRQMNA